MDSAMRSAEVLDDLQLANELLRSEHQLYERGVLLLSAASHSISPALQSFQLLLKDILVELSTKEAILAHWKSSSATIAADTLRVYCHAVIAHPRVNKGKVEWLVDMLQSASSEQKGNC